MDMKFLSTSLFLLLLSSSAFGFPSTTTTTTTTRVQLSSSSTSLLHSSTRLGMAVTEKRRVVVTGLGVISGCGSNPHDFFQACLDGTSSLARVQRFDASAYSCQIASEVLDFTAEDHFVNPKNVRSNDRFTHFAVASARMALQDAGLGDTPETLQNPARVGVMVGTAFGGVETFEQETLKLAKKPERPKVSGFVRSFARSLCHSLSHTTQFVSPFFLKTGLTIYHSRLVGQHGQWRHWH